MKLNESQVQALGLALGRAQKPFDDADILGPVLIGTGSEEYQSGYMQGTTDARIELAQEIIAILNF